MTDDDLSPPLILTVAPNGARRTKADHPALPMTAEEIAHTAAACAEAGAAMIHLHVRDRDGRHLLDAEAYRTVTAAIRREAGEDMIVQITTESVGLYPPEAQIAVVRETRPEAVSLAIRELVAKPQEESAAAGFFAWLHKTGIQAQYILYSDSDVFLFEDLLRRGILPDGPKFLLFVLGRYREDLCSSPRDLLPFLSAAPVGHRWMVCAFGPREIACGVTAAALGGHIRVGFENNLFLPSGVQAQDNAALVKAAARGVTAIGRSIASAPVARGLLGE